MPEGSETYAIAGAGLQADFARNEQVSFLDVIATHDTANRQAAVLMLNRDVDAEREVVLEWTEVTPVLTDESRRGMTVTGRRCEPPPPRQVAVAPGESRPGGRGLTKPVLIVRPDERYALA